MKSFIVGLSHFGPGITQTTLYFLEAQIVSFQFKYLLFYWTAGEVLRQKNLHKYLNNPFLAHLRVDNPTIFRLSSRQLSIVAMLILWILFVVNSHKLGFSINNY